MVPPVWINPFDFCLLPLSRQIVHNEDNPTGKGDDQQQTEHKFTITITTQNTPNTQLQSLVYLVLGSDGTAVIHSLSIIQEVASRLFYYEVTIITRVKDLDDILFFTSNNDLDFLWQLYTIAAYCRILV